MWKVAGRQPVQQPATVAVAVHVDRLRMMASPGWSPEHAALIEPMSLRACAVGFTW